MPKIVFVDSTLPLIVERLRAHTPPGFEFVEAGPALADRQRLARDADYLMTWAGPLPPELLAAAEKVKMIQKVGLEHATDRPIMAEIFRQDRRFPFLGVIGSKAKRAVLIKELTADGITPEIAEQFYCPIGLEIGTNQPGEIAISVVAQLIQERDRWRGKNERSHTTAG